MYRLFGDFDVAEEAVQGAVVEALRAWRERGVPDRPGGWLQVAARRNGLDLLRAARRAGAHVQRLGTPPPALEPIGTDDRLALLFACCHPALAPEARLALTLRAVVGLTTAQISRAFLVSESTMAQRIVRVKRKIVTAGIDLKVPEPAELPGRVDDVLTVVYVMYNEAFVSTSGAGQDRDLGDDAVWLAGVVATSLPGQAEAWGLAALLGFQHARAAARFDDQGSLVLLREQDRAQWDLAGIASADRLLERAAALRSPGRYQLQAAIAACHASAASWEDTDWLQIVTLYDVLIRLDRSPIPLLNRAVALSRLGRSREALGELDALANRLHGYHLWHATRAELLRDLGRGEQAHQADLRALGLTTNPAEQGLLAGRLRRHILDQSSGPTH